jgi:hypothetical protein
LLFLVAFKTPSPRLGREEACSPIIHLIYCFWGKWPSLGKRET